MVDNLERNQLRMERICGTVLKADNIRVGVQSHT